MPIHKLKLLKRREIARATIEFIFDKPDNLTFIPGQYAGFTLINPSETDAGGITRRFSMLSTPDDKHIAIATRVQNSAYKRVLNAMTIGDEIKFAGPTGAFTLHEDVNVPAIFIAGGIGITPFYSMIQDATRQHSPREFILFYGNQTPNDSIYLHELQQLQDENKNFTLVATMANADASWQGESGFITDSMIKKYVADITIPVFYICGSPAMVTALQETLVEMGIEEAKIKVEDFPGY
jgi:ferredoxin-NADP reductase